MVGGGQASYLPAGAEFFKGAVVTVTEPGPNGNSWHVEVGKADGTVFGVGDSIEWTIYSLCVNALS